MRRLTAIGLIVALAGVAVQQWMYIIIRNNPDECRPNWFACITPPIAITATGVFNLSVIVALIGAGLAITGLVRGGRHGQLAEA